ncbi:hypothetical protein Q5P01_011838 [Channa striata]|uniref:Uncharacterized protein n=1 Tax=Channa striata TaxID=64152 RepID=A0AA88MV57_CHASR|nr:hypothetical protein Q5P01_011838 [Channa striata]
MFERQRSALLSLLEDVSIAESNCPSGARVAVVGYSSYTKYLIRFHDYHRKKQLIEAVKNIAPERTSSRRHVGAAMRFVAHNIFKRTRAGALMKKVAIFFSTGPTPDAEQIVTANMEYQALNIFLSVVALRNIPVISRALEIDDSGNSLFTVLGRDTAADLRKVKKCVICYDPCTPTEECGFIQRPVPPQQVDVDLVLVADGSREMQADEYTGVQQLLGSVVEHLAVSQRPNRIDNQARVCVVQQNGSAPVVEFGLQTYQNHDQMRSRIYKMQQQSSSSFLGQTLDFTLREVFQKASNARKRRALMVVVGTQTAHADRAKLKFFSQKAKCEGLALFVVTVGNRFSRTQVEELASLPLQQHLIHVDKLRSEEQGFAQRFFRGFLSALDKGTNSYPPPSLRQICEKLKEQEGREILINGQGQGPLEEEDGFLAHTGGQTHLGQVDIFKTFSTAADQTFVSGFNRDALCQLDADAGVQCKDYVQAWSFDKHLGACSSFWYGGCGGNANRFSTESECLKKCASHHPDILPGPPLTSFVSKDACFFNQEPGNCQNYTMMWFFDTEQNECSRFWYSGCGGNENRFKTQEECENLCLTKSR